MKGLWITLGAIAVTAGVLYYFRDNENVKGALTKVKDTTNDTLNKINKNWGKAMRQTNGALAGQA
jgi:hypothetical protein